jgi:hypothetical protein
MNSRRLMGIPCMRGSHTLPHHQMSSTFVPRSKFE